MDIKCFFQINQPAPSLKKQPGIGEVIALCENPEYVIARAIDNGPISVWNVAKGKCLQAAVRVERGLSESSDVLLARSTRLVILTDRGYSSVVDESRLVFQVIITIMSFVLLPLSLGMYAIDHVLILPIHDWI